jgi:hypothetical protein
MSTTAPSEPTQRLCFVIGPIGHGGTPERTHADFLLLGLIKPVLEAPEFGYRVKRADEDADPGMINARMIDDILHADLVVADLTGLNPNALWELGVRHSAEKPVIHIAAAETKLPFDNFAQRTIFINISDWRSLETARSQLAASARLVNQKGYIVSNPITQANRSVKMRESADPLDRVIADMQAQIAALSRDVQRLATRDTEAVATLHALRNSGLGAYGYRTNALYGDGPNPFSVAGSGLGIAAVTASGGTGIAAADTPQSLEDAISAMQSKIARHTGGA